MGNATSSRCVSHPHSRPIFFSAFFALSASFAFPRRDYSSPVSSSLAAPRTVFAEGFLVLGAHFGVHEMHVDLRGGEVRVAEDALHHGGRRAPLHELCGEAMAKGVWRDVRHDARALRHLAYDALHGARA